MATALRPVGYDDRLSVVEHLDELRTRLMISAGAFVLALALAGVFNHQLLDVINRPLNTTTEQRTKEGKGLLGQIYVTRQAVRDLLVTDIATLRELSQSSSGLKGPQRAALVLHVKQLRGVLASLPSGPKGSQPVTLGPGEPFSATFTVAFYFALLASMPLILYQLFAFVLPAFSQKERRVAIPLMAMIPALFLLGVAFGYIIVLPAAVRFLQNFNSDQFNVLLQAKDYYKFAALALVAMGLVFQLPVAVLALTRVGIVTPEFLRRNWRYAIVILTVIAALLPGTDPVSTLIELVPLLLLYGLSVALASWLGRSSDLEDEEAPDPESLD